MKTPREVLLQQHQAAAPKLDAIRAAVVAALARPPSRETISWRDLVRSLRWHLAAISAVWALVGILNLSASPGQVAMIPSDKIPTPQQLWTSLRENRRLLLEYSDAPVVEAAAPAPGRRSQIAVQREVV
ncbi:MAG: hypothetical protein ABSG04_13295 [Verrucomicrobiota bacterium]|jgi:hypothetical protein